MSMRSAHAVTDDLNAEGTTTVWDMFVWRKQVPVLRIINYIHILKYKILHYDAKPSLRVCAASIREYTLYLEL